MFSTYISEGDYIRALKLFVETNLNFINVIFNDIPDIFFYNNVHLTDVIVQFLLYKINNNDEALLVSTDIYTTSVKTMYENVIDNSFFELINLDKFASNILTCFKRQSILNEKSNEFKLVYILNELSCIISDNS